MNDEREERTYSIRDLSLLKSFYRYLRPYRVPFFTMMALTLFVNAAFILEPLIFRFLINALVDYSGGAATAEQTVETAVLLILCDALLMVLAIVGVYFVNISLKKIGQKAICDLRQDVFEHILSLSTSSLKRMPIGSFVTRVTNDTQNLSLAFTDILPTLLRSVLSLTMILVLVFVYTHLYGFLVLAYLPVVFLLSALFRRKARIHYRGEKKAVSLMNAFLSENFTGIALVKSNAKEERMERLFDERNDEIYRHFLKSQNLFALFYPAMYLLQMSCILILFGFGIPMALSGALSLGDFNMLYSYSGQFFGPIQQITQLMNTLQQVISSAERIDAVMKMEEEEDDKEGIDVPSFRGEVVFSHVSFSYVEGQEVLHDVSFRIPAGKTAAFVGQTGAGKSTIISLLTRTYLPQRGEITIDGVDIRRYTLSCLRRNIGLMLQDVFLFTGTVAENISLKDEGIAKEEIVAAAREVGADKAIDSLPGGYDEKVLERGENFSAGARQLLSFARTLVYRPSMILLDEATANIDTRTEKTIQDSLERIRKVGTMVIVAHRLSTIRNADLIFVVDKGRIAEEGDHQALLQRRGIYYNLYRLQNMQNRLDHREETNEDSNQAL